MIETLDDWEVRAVRDRETLAVGVFRGSYPDDAVVVVATVVRAKFDLHLNGSDSWAFWCLARAPDGQTRRRLVFGIAPTGRPLLLADSARHASQQRDADPLG